MSSHSSCWISPLLPERSIINLPPAPENKEQGMEPQSGGFNSRYAHLPQSGGGGGGRSAPDEASARHGETLITKRPARLEPRRTPCWSGERRGFEDTGPRAPCAPSSSVRFLQRAETVPPSVPDGKTSAGHRQAFVIASPPRGRLLNRIPDEQQLQWESNVTHVAAD
ncbi:unnamed protein product [Arctogadus glacialis]